MGEGVRRLLLDSARGERRGVVLLDGRPERLLIEREGEPPRALLGEMHVGRLRALTPARDRGYVELVSGTDGVAAFLPGAAPPLGAALRVEVATEACADKGPRLRALGPAKGPVRRLAPPPTLESRLAAFAPGVALETGLIAREAAEMAAEAALATSHPLGRGLTLHVEPARALTAVDVDLAEGAKGRRAAEQTLRAIRHAVRLLRLKGLGGVAVIDLAGAPRGPRLLAEALRALGPDGDEALALAPDRLGLLRLVRPRTIRPLAETLALAATLAGDDRRPHLSAR